MSDKCKIEMFMHCAACLDELPDGMSPAAYSNLTIGPTNDGTLQVWCNRHDLEVFDSPPTRKPH